MHRHRRRCGAALKAGPIAAYIGFDCTADSLHVGSLVQIMMLRLLQKHGHRPVVLMGGGTTRIGDPSGKDESRQMLTDEEIAANMAGIRRCFAPFLTLRRRADRRDDGRTTPTGSARSATSRCCATSASHFTINRMLTFDSVQAAAGPRAAADLPRIQLHDPAELRFPRAAPPPRRGAADGRVGPVGQHRLRHGADAAHRRRARCSA